VVDDALDFAAVDAEFAGYGALAAAGGVPGPYRLIHRWRVNWNWWCTVFRHRLRFVVTTGRDGCLCGVGFGSDEGHEEFEGSGEGQGGPRTDHRADESMT
jgi:hypothetical protein